MDVGLERGDVFALVVTEGDFGEYRHRFGDLGQDDAAACTLAYMAVAASHRRRGIARAVQDLTPVFQSTEVRQIHAYLLKQNGKKAMSEAEKQRDYHLDQLAHQARQLVAERLTPTLH